jgi:hypothetical protein
VVAKLSFRGQTLSGRDNASQDLLSQRVRNLLVGSG